MNDLSFMPSTINAESDERRVLRYWAMLISQALPPALVAAALTLAAAWRYDSNPIDTDLSALPVAHTIVHEQVERLAGHDADVALFGDSSCLMGINTEALAAALNTRVSNYCTVAHPGPGGTARMLQRLPNTKSIVLAMHAAGFTRDEQWDRWLSYIDGIGGAAASAHSPLKGGLDYVRTQLVGRLVYRPMPGVYGRYYGSADALRTHIRDSGGTAIDPQWALQWPTEVAFKRATASATTTVELQEPFDFELNTAFRNSLAQLSVEVAQRDNVYLIVTPVPTSIWSDATDSQYQETLDELAAALAISRHKVLNVPPALPDTLFSGRAHLNRWGQLAYTRLLAKALGEAGA